MIRFTVQTADFGDAMHIGGPVLTSLKTFEVRCPEMELFLSEYAQAIEKANAKKTPVGWNRQLVGFEIVPFETMEAEK